MVVEAGQQASYDSQIAGHARIMNQEIDVSRAYTRDVYLSLFVSKVSFDRSIGFFYPKSLSISKDVCLAVRARLSVCVYLVLAIV